MLPDLYWQLAVWQDADVNCAVCLFGLETGRKNAELAKFLARSEYWAWIYRFHTESEGRHAGKVRRNLAVNAVWSGRLVPLMQAIAIGYSCFFHVKFVNVLTGDI